MEPSNLCDNVHGLSEDKDKTETDYSRGNCYSDHIIINTMGSFRNHEQINHQQTDE
jgi:hypothetical protein